MQAKDTVMGLGERKVINQRILRQHGIEANEMPEGIEDEEAIAIIEEQTVAKLEAQAEITWRKAQGYYNQSRRIE